MKKCIHCLDDATTKDHVFPSAWYTEDTPSSVQRWTVPSCSKCNEKFGRIEQDLLFRMVPCIDPAKPGVKGLKEKFYASLGMGLKETLEPKEFEKRFSQAKKLRKELMPFKEGFPIFPNFGLHDGYAPESQFGIKIPPDSLRTMLGKIFRGAEYKLNQKRLIEEPYKLEVFEAVTGDIADVDALFLKYGQTTALGPGFKLDRASGENAVLYRTVIWDTWVGYGSIDLA